MLSRPSGSETPPGGVLRVSNVPPRDPGFTGRDGLLAAVRERLVAVEPAVQALHGPAGAGKTQLANEYAHRFARAYELVWWIDAGQAGLIGEQLAALAVELGCVDARAGLPAIRSAVLASLREREGWLLVFDGATDPAEVAGWLPGGGGHVLITSREPDWGELAVPLEIGSLAPAESAAILRFRVPGLAVADADLLGARLGDLALAVVQAAGFLAKTGTAAGEYMGLLDTAAREPPGQGGPVPWPPALAAATRLTADRLASDDPVAADLATLCSFLAPEPIPESLFTGALTELPGPLAARLTGSPGWRETVAQLTQLSMARTDHRGVQLHPLIQAILRHRLTPEQAAVARTTMEAILVASDPGEVDDPSAWPGWARLMPHLLAAGPATTASPDLRGLANRACYYLLARGDARTCHELAAEWYRQWRERLGGDAGATLAIARTLAIALRALGRNAEALDLDKDSLARERRLCGADHPNTLVCAINLAAGLRAIGDVRAARDLDRETLDRCRRVLGEDHPDTLACAGNLAIDLSALGDLEAARDLDRDILDRYRRVLGEDHPGTLACAGNLAIDLSALGDLEAARDLNQDTLARRRRVLGEDHPDSLACASGLAAGMRALGDVKAARDLEQDTLARRRRVLGEDHPDTLVCASSLAADLRELGELEAARDLNQDTLARYRRVLGEDHPDSLACASNLAAGLRALGDAQAAHDLGQDTLARYRHVLGENHPDTLACAGGLAADLSALGELEAARDLNRDTLARYRRVLGEDHPDTLACAGNLAADLSALGDLEAARDLDQDTLARYRRTVGEDDPGTLAAASSLAIDLSELGEVKAARELEQDTLARYRRVLGEDHPDTLACAGNLAADLRRLDDVQAARDLEQDTLARYRRVLGEDHPDTLASASNLAADLRRLGEVPAARD